MSSGTDKIISSIMSEAQDKADKNIQEAQAKVNIVTNDANKEAEAEKNKILDSGKKQSDMRYQQIISEAKMNARRAELGAKEEVIEAAFAKATEDLKAKASSDDAEYSESLIKMIEEATEELEFESPKEVLKHIKSTGVNCLNVKNFYKSGFLKFEKEYKKLFDEKSCVKLTYHPIYIVAKKN